MGTGLIALSSPHPPQDHIQSTAETPRSDATIPTHEADIIIVGGGTAGLVLAARLSPNPNLHILVLEAGNDTTSDPRSHTPALRPGLLNTENEWGFNIAPQAALGGKEFRQPQGRQLGGSSGLNGKVFIANSRANVDGEGGRHWGMRGRIWDTLGPYYRRVYRMTLPKDPAKIEELGLEYVDVNENGVAGSADGPIQASFADAVDNPSAGAWVRTLRGLGYTMRGDPFSSHPVLGGYVNALAIDPVTETRSYSANAYYLPVKDRPNLRVSCTSGAEPTATGVEYTMNGGETLTAKAGHEVILSAGAINTPKLLELSGIGSPAIVNRFAIPVRVDNPHVGENLQDHLMAGFADLETGLREGTHVLALTELEQDKVGDDDPPINSAATNARAAFLRYLIENHHNQATAAYFIVPSQVDFRDTGVAPSHPPRPENYMTIFAMLAHPLSRWSTHITSASPSAPPLIDPRYLSHPADVDLLSRHVRFIDTVASSPPLSNILKPEGVGKRSPGVPPNLRTAPLDEVASYVRNACMNNYHTAGTSAMMPREKGDVVEARLRVYGVKGLRVVDASVVPIIPSGNTQSTVYAIAERAADLVLEDYI
ncbi:hypothetical protein BJX68DRAFT_257916 [Aspergillus pseudodeflectus]|uniref:Glucose-methanol-choline oxidoreductase N-terminal domain-containing protein n=1 Tax=Aspergillus pseudodeflectus TaxID=176178 RepID=A0ABR4JPG5_9EURO